VSPRHWRWLQNSTSLCCRLRRHPTTPVHLLAKGLRPPPRNRRRRKPRHPRHHLLPRLTQSKANGAASASVTAAATEPDRKRHRQVHHPSKRNSVAMASAAVAVAEAAMTMRLLPPRHRLRFSRPSLLRLRRPLQRRDKIATTNAVANVAAAASATTPLLLPRSPMYHRHQSRLSPLRLFNSRRFRHRRRSKRNRRRRRRLRCRRHSRHLRRSLPRLQPSVATTAVAALAVVTAVSGASAAMTESLRRSRRSQHRPQRNHRPPRPPQQAQPLRRHNHRPRHRSRLLSFRPRLHHQRRPASARKVPRRSRSRT